MDATPPPPTRELLAALVRRAMARGLSGPDAEDVVMRSWARAAAAFAPARGSFEALLLAAVDNECRFWWRTWQRRATRELLLVPGDEDAPTDALALAEANQERVLAALTDDERRLFSTWALQKHLPNGRFPAAQAAASLDLDVRGYNNAKKRLKARLGQILAELGLTTADLLPERDDGRTRRLVS